MASNGESTGEKKKVEQDCAQALVKITVLTKLLLENAGNVIGLDKNEIHCVIAVRELHRGKIQLYATTYRSELHFYLFYIAKIQQNKLAVCSIRISDFSKRILSS